MDEISMKGLECNAAPQRNKHVENKNSKYWRRKGPPISTSSLKSFDCAGPVLTAEQIDLILPTKHFSLVPV